MKECLRKSCLVVTVDSFWASVICCSKARNQPANIGEGMKGRTGGPPSALRSSSGRNSTRASVIAVSSPCEAPKELASSAESFEFHGSNSAVLTLLRTRFSTLTSSCFRPSRSNSALICSK